MRRTGESQAELPLTNYESGGQEFESLRARQFSALPVRITRHSHWVRHTMEGLSLGPKRA
jgi:hypothetical protein